MARGISWAPLAAWPKIPPKMLPTAWAAEAAIPIADAEKLDM